MKKTIEFIRDRDGSLSHTKLWSNIANLAATVAFLYHVFENKAVTADLLAVYVAAVGLQRFGSKFLDKHTISKKEEKTV